MDDTEIDDDGTREAHPLVATRALLQGRVAPLPGAHGARAPSGRMGSLSLGAAMAVAEALFSTEQGPPPAERMAWLRGEFDDFMARCTPQGRWLFTLAALVVSFAAPLFIGKLPGLSRLALGDRVRALERFERRPVGAVLIALRAILCLLYYEHPQAAQEVGVGVRGPRDSVLLGEAP